MQENRIIEIEKPRLFSFSECLWFLDRNFDDTSHTVVENAVWKALKLNEEVLLIKVCENGSKIIVEIIKGKSNAEIQQQIKSYITDWFDLNTNLSPFYKLLKTDQFFSYMAKDYKGLRLMGIVDLFESLCWCVIGQQINLAFAYKVKRRLVERFGTKVDYKGRAFYIFPDYNTLINVSIEELKNMQFSSKKAEYIIGISKAFCSGLLSKKELMNLPDSKSRHELLVSLKGIGTWTANYVQMKTLRDPSSIPHGDAGLIKALKAHNIIEDKSEIKKITSLFNKYQNWESYLVLYLWRSLSNKAISEH